MVIQEDGRSISAHLRNGIHSTPIFPLPDVDGLLDESEMVDLLDPNIDDNPIEVRSRRPWTIDEDMTIVKQYGILGKKWTLISRFLTDRTGVAVRNRFLHLYPHIFK